MSKLDDLKNKKLELESLLYSVCKEIAAEKVRLSTDGEIGNRYGLLKVIELSEIRKSRKYFKCVCDCGNNVIAEMTQLRMGKTKSCGCLRAIKARNNINIIHISKQRQDRKGAFNV
jgi:hypothetical protein